jgi:hypothetical protein
MLFPKKNKRSRWFVLLAKALGEKVGNTDEEADRVAYIRICIVAIYVIANIFIIAGVIRHW